MIRVSPRIHDERLTVEVVRLSQKGMGGNNNDLPTSRLGRLQAALKPLLHNLLYQGLQPSAATRWAFEIAFDAHWSAREAMEWAHRALVATPLFLAKCAKFGERISCDRVPYITSCPSIELGSDIRISGQINIKGNSKRSPVLRIGHGVFIGHNCSLAVAELVEIGDFSAIGGGTYIADTEGHSNYNPMQPIWFVAASDDDIEPVVIEDNVQIGRNCMIMKGVRVGARSVIGAGSVLRSSVPPDSVVMGNPARVVKRMSAEPIAANSAKPS
jgi:acetyltransferase-like isoleucine patch superfamily enzyme